MAINTKKVYQFVFAIFILTFTLNSIRVYGRLKLFYLFIPILITYFFVQKKIKLSYENTILLLLAILSSVTVISSYLSYSYSVIFNAFYSMSTLFVLSILCIIYSNILDISSLNLFAKFSVIGTITLVIDFLYNFNGNRYGGFFGGPNYFNSLIILFITFIILNMEINHNTVSKFKYIVFCISIIVLTIISLFTASRSGLLALIILYVFYFIYSVKKNGIIKTSCIFVFIIVITIVLINFTVLDITGQFEYLMTRIIFEKGSSDWDSSMMRINEIVMGINMVKERPITLLVGSGIGSTDMLDWFVLYCDNLAFETSRIHNTYLSVLFEQGIISLLVFIYLILYVIYKILMNNNDMKYLYLGILLSQLAISTFIWNLTFTPFWITFFTVSQVSAYDT